MRSYVIRATVTVAGFALTLDVINQLVFFENWTITLRSWAITITIVSIIAAPLFTEVGRAYLELYEANANLEVLSRRDHLTGLPNRRAILEFAASAESQCILLLIIDLDRFKTVNDTYGHQAGDKVLQEIARRLHCNLGDIGLIGRIGGEEFVIVAVAHDPGRLIERIDEFCDSMATTPIELQGAVVRLTMSIGASIGLGSAFDDVYREADQALYTAKESGRNRVCLAPRLRRRIPQYPNSIARVAKNAADVRPMPRLSAL